jgi:hypothetical protein
MDQTQIQAVLSSLTEASQHLAETAGILADNAVPAAGIATAVPPAGLPAAQLLSDSAVPVARSARVIANAVPAFAPLLNR